MVLLILVKTKNKIRHVMRPSVSYGYTPSFEKYYDTYASDASGTIHKAIFKI
jgi:hypothetical protein